MLAYWTATVHRSQDLSFGDFIIAFYLILLLRFIRFKNEKKRKFSEDYAKFDFTVWVDKNPAIGGTFCVS